MKFLLTSMAGMVVGAIIMYFVVNKPQQASVFSKYKFARSHSGPISIADARTMHQGYLKECRASGDDSTRILRYLRVDKSDLDKLLKNLDTSGAVRIYFGLRTQNKLTPEITTFIVGVDTAGKLQLPVAGRNQTMATADIIDNLPSCPDDCPNNNGDIFN